MRVRAAFFVVIVMAAGGLVGVPADGAPLPVVRLECGTTWGNDPGEGSFRLGNNLRCDEDGVFVIGDGITVDLGGHRISGDDGVGDEGDSGLLIGGNGVKVRNGVIDGFDRGVLLVSGRNHRVDNLVVTRSQIAGVRVNAADKSTISRNTITSGGIQIDAAHDNLVESNVLSRSGITVSNARRNTIQANKIYVPPVNGIDIDGIAIGNRIVKNTVLGAAGNGVEADGQSVQGTTISKNTIRGSAGRGIRVVAADTTRIVGNTVTANVDGISVLGGVDGADEVTVLGNTASANTDDGIELGVQTEPRVEGNVANENGDNGIEIFGGTPAVVDDNVTNFNGYLNGDGSNNDGFGITATLGTGGGNKAKGNDVAAGQCSSNDANLCVDGSPKPPPLTDCDDPITEDFTLRHPLVCGTFISAMRVSGSGFTVNLGPHVLRGGTAIGSSALEVVSSSDGIVIRGGVLSDSEQGVFFPAASPAKRITIVGSLIARNDTFGIAMKGVDATPDDADVLAGHNVVERTTIIGNGDDGIAVTSAPRNRFWGNTIAGNAGDGIAMLSSQLNRFSANTVLDHPSSGLRAEDATANVLSGGLKITNNRFVANQGETINLVNTPDLLIDGNALRGNGNSSADEVIDLDGNTTGGAPGGSNDNRIRNNRIEGNSATGITLRADSRRNVVQDNVVRANDENGIVVLGDAEDNTIRGNKASENGADNVDLERDAGILVLNRIDGDEIPDKVIDNVANFNGFLNEPTGDGNGFGIAFGNDTIASGNKAKGNDADTQCDPDPLC